MRWWDFNFCTWIRSPGLGDFLMSRWEAIQSMSSSSRAFTLLISLQLSLSLTLSFPLTLSHTHSTPIWLFCHSPTHLYYLKQLIIPHITLGFKWKAELMEESHRIAGKPCKRHTDSTIGQDHAQVAGAAGHLRLTTELALVTWSECLWTIYYANQSPGQYLLPIHGTTQGFVRL